MSKWPVHKRLEEADYQGDFQIKFGTSIFDFLCNSVGVKIESIQVWSVDCNG